MSAFNEMAGRIERLVQGQKALLANVSHELRSPLARIRVALALLPQTPARISDLERDLDELDRLIDDVLTGSRLEATGLPPRLDHVDLRRLLGDMAERAAYDPVTRGLEVRVEPGDPLLVVAAAALLRRAVWNLVENAAKYGAPPIVLAATREGDGAVLTVTDHGPGIPVDERDRVVEPFYRRDAARTPSAADQPSQGFGLGLTLARQIAVAHGGSLTVGPAAAVDGREQGCRVSLRLPVDPTASPPGST